MVLKIHGQRFSPCTRRVAAVCEEYQVPYELVNLNLFKKENQSEVHLKIQPFGQVPYIDDDGFILYESRAISRYIATKYRGNIRTPLFPDASTETEKLAKFEQAASVEAANWDPYAAVLVHELMVRPARGFGVDTAYAARILPFLYTTLDVYEKILFSQKYLAGDEVSLIDIFHLPYGSYLGLQDIIKLADETKRPNVARWWKDISSRPSWKAVEVKVPDSFP